ncbi:MAG: hypothetical protein GTN40_05405 [Candidatus Aenigmarchaeota archaeon]|nr:hypothetical protein [Candidatus Aenigmarchaeota archaeon]
MKKKHWIIFIILFVCVDLIIFYFLYPSLPAQTVPIISPEQQDGEGETETPGNLTFPWSPQESSGTEGAGPEEGGEGGGEGGSGGSGGGEETTPTGPLIYTLRIQSDPSNLSVFVNYNINGIVSNITQMAPFSLEVDSNSVACVLAYELRGSGTLKWTKDGEECISSSCYPPFFGCEVLMDSDHTVTEHWIVNWTE